MILIFIISLLTACSKGTSNKTANKVVPSLRQLSIETLKKSPKGIEELLYSSSSRDQTKQFDQIEKKIRMYMNKGDYDINKDHILFLMNLINIMQSREINVVSDKELAIKGMEDYLKEYKTTFIKRATKLIEEILKTEYRPKKATFINHSLSLEINNSEIVKGLIDLKVSFKINEQDSYGYTALIGAVKIGSNDLVSTLIKLGADVNLKTKDNQTALSYAASKGNVEAVKLLLKTGKIEDINIKSKTYKTNPLMSAVKGNYKEIVDALIKAKADLEIRDNIRKKPLEVALEYKHEEIALALLKAGANPNIKRDPLDEIILELAEQIGNKEIIGLIKESLKK